MARTILSLTHITSASLAGTERIEQRKGFYESQFKITHTCVYISRVRIGPPGTGSSEACDDVRRLDGHAARQRTSDFARRTRCRLHGGDGRHGSESRRAQYWGDFYRARKPAAPADAGRTRYPAAEG